MFAFSSPSLLSVSSPRRVHSKIPVCVLNEQRPVVSPLRVDERTPSKYYCVVDDEEVPATLPPPPPRHYSLPMIGYILEHFLNLGDPKSRTAKYGPLYVSNFLMGDFLYVNYLPVMHDILRDTDSFTSHFDMEKFNKLFGDDNILMVDGPQHMALRSLIAPAFSPSMFASYFPAILNSSERLWRNVAEQVQGNAQVKLEPLLQKHYMGIIIQMTSGIDSSSELCEYVGSRFMSLFYGFLGPTWGPLWDRTVKLADECKYEMRKILAYKLVHDSDVIEQLRAGKQSILQTKETLKRGLDIMHVALAESGLPTGTSAPQEDPRIDTIINLVFVIWLAGFFTSAATTSCAVFELGMDSSGEFVRRLVAEQDELVASDGPEITLSQINSKMPLLDSYIAEIMRLYPAGDGIARTVKKDMVLMGKTVKRDTTLFMDLKAAHRDESIYPRADEIIIDRFLAKPGVTPQPKNVAFGDPLSPHYCVGARLAKVMMKCSLSVLLRNYRLDLDPKQSRNYKIFPENTPVSQVVVRGLHNRKE